MKRLIPKIILTLLYLLFTSSPMICESWEDYMDSTDVYLNQNNFPKALEWCLKAQDAAKMELGENDSNYIYVIYTTAYLYYDNGKFFNAHQQIEEALSLCREVFNYRSDLYVEVICMAATYNHQFGNFERAEELFLEALELNQSAFKEDDSRLATTLNNIGYFYKSTGRLSEAEKYYNETLMMLKRIHPDGHPNIALIINNLAVLYNDNGNYSKAEPLYKESLEMQRRIYKNDHNHLASILNNIAYFYENLGNYQEAAQYYKEALEMRRRLFIGDHPDLALSINNMAYFYVKLGDFDKAEQLNKEAVEMRKRIFQKDHPDLAQSLHNLGGLLFDKDDLAEAEKYLSEAWEMRKRLFKTEHPILSTSMKTIAHLYERSDRKQEAELLMNESVNILKRAYEYNHPNLAKSLILLAEFYSRNNALDKALPIYEEGLNVYKGVLEHYFPSLSEKEKEYLWNTMRRDFQHFFSFLIESKINNTEVLGFAYDILLGTKGMLLNSTIRVKNRILGSGDKNLIRKYEEWLHLKDKIGKLYSLSDSERSRRKINLDSMIKSANEREKEISKLSEYFAKEYEKKNNTWIDIQKKLQNDEAALEIARVRLSKNNRWLDTVFYIALIIKKDSRSPELVVIDNGIELEQKYFELYRKQIERHRKAAYDPDAIELVMQNLYNIYWEPFGGKLKGIKRIYLSPDGIYNQINLNTLMNPVTSKYLLEEKELLLQTRTSDLLERHEKTKLSSKAVLFGDPQYDLDSRKYTELALKYSGDRSRQYYLLDNVLDDSTRAGIAPLPGTRLEVETIKKQLKSKKWEVESYIGTEALEEAIKSVNSPRILHIATHGKFIKDSEIGNERSTSLEIQGFSENPLLRSFLLFAGAENTLLNVHNPFSQVDDGLLTAYEAMNLNLDNTDLVVLSACETGLGEIKNGEGVYGLQRAFKQAGAKSLIMSLWTVNDQTTQELMTEFYKQWLSGKSKRAAFKEAQLYLKKNYPSFYFWGAFVLVGE